MSGIYIHIPFCKSRCIYCGFYSTTHLDECQRYVDAVCSELSQRHSQEPVSTIYLGGGTPSQLSIGLLSKLFSAIYRYNSIDKSPEITIEVNPDDITTEFVSGLKTLPINRISMGVQTFSDARLRFLRRRHTSAQVTKAVHMLQNAGFSNISIDLMFGFPDESCADFEHDISHALALQVQHISAYSLMVEEHTPLYNMIYGPRPDKSIALTMPDEETSLQIYELLIDRLTDAGFIHYEISNFAKPGFISRHNSSYWSGIPYLGFGAAAHSYDGHYRSWNVSNIQAYIQGMLEGRRIFEFEEINGATRYNDRITTALRTLQGLSLTELSASERDYCLHAAQKYLDSRLLKLTDSSLSLTRQGLFVSDMVMSDLMMV